MVLTAKRPQENDDPVLLTGATCHAIMDAVEIVERESAKTKPTVIKGNRQGFEIQAKNNTDRDLKLGHVVGVGDPTLTPDDTDRVRFYEPRLPAEIPEQKHIGRFAVMTTAIPAGNRYGTAVFRGVCWAYIRYTNKDNLICRADIDEDKTDNLVPHPAGGADVLYKPNGTGRLLCLVNIESQPPILVYGQASGDISPDSTGKMSVANAGEVDGFEIEVILRKPHGNQKISDGKYMGAIWSPCEKQWSVLPADCET